MGFTDAQPILPGLLETLGARPRDRARRDRHRPLPRPLRPQFGAGPPRLRIVDLAVEAIACASRADRRHMSLRPAGLTRGEAIPSRRASPDRDCFVASLLAMTQALLQQFPPRLIQDYCGAFLGDHNHRRVGWVPARTLKSLLGTHCVTSAGRKIWRV